YREARDAQTASRFSGLFFVCLNPALPAVTLQLCAAAVAGVSYESSSFVGSGEKVEQRPPRISHRFFGKELELGAALRMPIAFFLPSKRPLRPVKSFLRDRGDGDQWPPGLGQTCERRRGELAPSAGMAGHPRLVCLVEH